VTGARPASRQVHSLNGRSAVGVFASLLGVAEEDLRDRPLASIHMSPVQLGYRVGSEWFMRSVVTVEDDALRLSGVVEEGAVLTLMRAGDLLEETERGMAGVLDRLQGEAAFLLLFNCGGRLLEARARGMEVAFAKAMQPVPGVGFTTYGEQFGAMHVNHTLSGLAFGWPDGR